MSLRCGQLLDSVSCELQCILFCAGDHLSAAQAMCRLLATQKFHSERHLSTRLAALQECIANAACR